MISLFRTRLSSFVEVLVSVTMLAGLALIATLYWTIPLFTGHHPGKNGSLFTAYLIVLAVSGLLGELILWQARGILRNVNSGNPFCPNTVRRLRVIAGEVLVMACFYLVMIFIIRKFYMAIVVAICLLAGLILLVFAALFRQAVTYKEENDMTI